MLKPISEVNHPLSSPIQYTSEEGKVVEATFVKLISPSSKHLNDCAFLKQAFFRALPTSTQNAGTTKTDDKGKDDNDLDPDEVMGLLAMSDKVDYAAVLMTASHLFTLPGVALLDGQVPMTKFLVEQLSMEDLEGMAGKYLANFILSSALRKLSGRS